MFGLLLRPISSRLFLTRSFFILTLFVFGVPGDIIIKQVPADGSSPSWTVRGLATYEFGGGSPKIFNFQCTSTINDGNGLFWTKNNGVTSKTQSKITNGIELQFTTPIMSDAGLYTCKDTMSTDLVDITITSKTPAALATASTLTHYSGDTVTIDMYASALTPLENNQITWKLNNTEISDGSFTNDKTSLVISNISSSNAGVYKMIVTVGSGGLITTDSANTTLTVLEPPTVTAHPSDVVNALEWSSIELSCTASGSGSLTVEWFREDGDLPSTQSVQTSKIGSTVVSTLNITELRVADGGYYYCNVSTSDGVRHAVSDPAVVTVTVNTRLSYVPSGGSSQSVSKLLYTPSSSSFHVDCEGSGSKYWTGPDNSNISYDAATDPYQYSITDTGYQRVNFSSFLDSYRGLYTCVSLEGTTPKSVYITNMNPAIYTDTSEIAVGRVTNVTIRVYVDGSDPTPSSSDITWLFNSNALPDEQYYSLENGNQDLVISNALSNMTTGRYECRVSTTKGTGSVFVNVSYFDPPIVTVHPKTITVREGGVVSFNCSVSSDLDTVINWYREGEIVQESQDGILTISDTTSSDAGTYYCEAVDSEAVWNIRENVDLIVKYGPTPYVGISTTDKQMSLTNTLEEGVSAPTYFCSSDGYPQPELEWRFNGGNLPEGISQQLVRLVSEGQYAQLIWTRRVEYSDNGTFSCHASNEINSSTSNLFMKIYVTPVIVTIYPVLPVGLKTVSPLTFSVPPSFNGSILTCVARGLPVSSIKWVDSNGVELTSMFVSRLPSGFVEVMLNWDSALLSSPVQCKVTNDFGNDSKSVRFVEGRATSTNTTSIPDPPSDQVVTVRIKLNSTQCSNEFRSLILDSLILTTKLVIVSQCQSCDYNDMDVDVSSSVCDSASAIFLVTITTSALEQTAKAYRALGEWVTTSPVIFYSNKTYQVDPECAFLVQGSDSSFSCDPVVMSHSSTTQSTPTNPPTAKVNTLMPVWIAIVIVIVLLLVVVAGALIVVLCLCIKSINQKNQNGDGSKTNEAWSVGDISLNTWRTASTHPSTQELTTSYPPGQLQRSHSSGESNSGTMLDNQAYHMRPQLEHIRQMSNSEELLQSHVRILPTTPTNEQVDSPSPNGAIGHPGMRILSFTNPTSKFASEESLQTVTPINEKLYMPLNQGGGGGGGDPAYAQIRPSAIREGQQGSSHQVLVSPTRGGVVRFGMRDHRSYSEHVVPPHPNHRRSTLPSRISPTRKNTKSPVHYTEPHSQVLMARDQRYVAGRTTTSSPALHQPLPYSEPVPSMGSLRNVGIHHHPDPEHTRAVSSPTGASHVQRGRLSSPLRSVDEGSPSQQQWYNSGDSDIVTPSSQPAYSYDTSIEPYATTLSSQIKASPYSQPSPDWQSSMVSDHAPVSGHAPVSSSLPEDPAVLLVDYKMINV